MLSFKFQLLRVRIEEVEEMIAAKTNDIKMLTGRISRLENLLKEKDVMLHEAMKTVST